MNRVKMGTSPYITGTVVSDMGMHASSAIIRVTANSKGCSSPSCFLPISRMAISRNTYMSTARTNTISIRLVFVAR